MNFYLIGVFPSHNSENGSTIFFYNGKRISEAFINLNTSQRGVQGLPKYQEQFLVLGQEPDLFRGGYDALQSFQGKISRFNWWRLLLDDSSIERFAKCDANEYGDIVAWSKESFETTNIFVEEIDSIHFCRSEAIIFFAGRRNRYGAADLCRSHGGWVVVPNSQDDNQVITDLYNQNLEQCKDDASGMIGWLGVTISDRETYSQQLGSENRKANYTNYVGQ